MIIATTVQNFEQKYAAYQHIALYCAIAAGVFLVLTIILFLVLKIPQVFGELPGRTARKAVQEMTENHPQSGKLQKKNISPAKKKTSRKDKKTEKPEEQEARRRSYHDLVGENDTPVSLVSHADMPTPAIIHPREKTPTEDLDQTTVLQSEAETAVLGQNDLMETTVLDAVRDSVPTGKLSVQPETVKVLRSIVEIHTDEVI